MRKNFYQNILYIILPFIAQNAGATPTISYPDAAIIGSSNKDYTIDLISGNGRNFIGTSKNHSDSQYNTIFKYNGSTSNSYNLTLSIGNPLYMVGTSDDGSIIAANVSAGSYNYGIVLNNGTANYDLYSGTYDSSYVEGVSSNGTVLFNVSDSTTSGDEFTYRAFLYSSGGTATPITTSLDYTDGIAISRDSSTIVGGYRENPLDNISAFKYSGGSFTNLGFLPGFTSLSYALATSDDGSVIAGASALFGAPNQYRAFGYNSTDGMFDLGTIAAFGSGGNYEASIVSGDGSVIVGHANNGTDDVYDTSGIVPTQQHAFKYTDADGIVDIGVLSGKDYSLANAISADGSIIVGRSGVAGSTASDLAFKYEDGEMTSLGTLGTRSVANAISRDGKIIVGSYDTADGYTRGFIYRSTSMVDIENTYASSYINAAKINSVINLKSAVLNNSLNQDCNQFGANNFCLGISTRYSAVNKNNFTQDYSGILRVAYKINPYLRVGFSLDQQADDHTPAQISVSNKTPMSSIFTNISQNKDGSGLNFRLAAAYNKARIGATRDLLYGSEAGSGRAGLNSSGILASVSQSFKLKDKFRIIPSIGIRHTELTRNAYTENSGATFLVSYDKFKQKTTAAILALNFSMPVTKDVDLMIGGGVEHNLAASLDSYSGSISSLGNFSYKSSNLKTNRAFFNSEISYDIAKNQRISSSIFYGKQQLNNANVRMIYFNYSVGL